MISDNLQYMLAFPPAREGFNFVLYQHRDTGLYQWINDPEFAALFDMIQIFPAPVIGAGFGYSTFGFAPYGS